MSDHSVTPEVMTIDQLEVSPLNVRRHRATIEATTAMEASIMGSGLIQALNVHPMRGSKKFGAFAGGRRCRAIRNLVDRGDLRPDWPVKVEVYRGFSDVEIIELSLGENIPRAELELYEICAAIRALSQRGERTEAIAHALGQPLPIVQKWHRVGQLAEPLFAAFSEGKLAVDRAQAYAATEDRKLQLAVWEQLSALPDWEQAPAKIRAALKVGDVEAARMLRFIGDESYRTAGGRFELDLFADEAVQRGRVVDEPLLRQLVDDRLSWQRENLRRRTSRPELRFVAQPPQREHQGADQVLRVEPGTGPDDAIVLPEGDIVARLYLSEAGEPVADWWWSSRSAKYGSERQARPTSLRAPAPSSAAAPAPAGDAPAAPIAGKPPAAPADDAQAPAPALVEILRSVRRLVMRGMLVRGPWERVVGLDYLVWAQLRLMLDPQARPSQVGMRAIGALDVDPDDARPSLGSITASRRWRDALEQLRDEAFIAEADMAAAFRAFRAADLGTKQLAGAVVAGLALERSVATGTHRLPVHDAVAAECRVTTDAELRKFWEPSAEQLAAVPAHQRLAIADPFVERVTLGAWQRLKSADLTARVLELVTGSSAAVKASMADAARIWVHPLLRFGTAAPPAPLKPVAAELEEAA